MKAREAYTEAAQAVASGRGDPKALAALARAAAEEEWQARLARARETWTEWSPASVPHVKGRWTQRVIDTDGLPEEQMIEATCTGCGAVFKRTCTSGLVKSHVLRFAHVHAICAQKPSPAK